MTDKPPIKEMAVLTLCAMQDGHLEAFVTSHPDGNDVEKLLQQLCKLIKAMQDGKPTGIP